MSDKTWGLTETGSTFHSLDALHSEAIEEDDIHTATEAGVIVGTEFRSQTDSNRYVRVSRVWSSQGHPRNPGVTVDIRNEGSDYGRPGSWGTSMPLNVFLGTYAPVKPATADQRVAELEAEIAQLHDKHKASLRRADQVNNELMEEVQRYAEGTERPVLWSVYNRMHARALAAEAKLAEPAGHDTDLTAAERKFLTWALGCAAAVMFSEYGFTDEDGAALARLHRLAAGAES